mgnify:CR=1 FL=1
MTYDYDLIVIGAGMAGVTAANKCASAGWKVAIVDALPYVTLGKVDRVRARELALAASTGRQETR